MKFRTIVLSILLISSAQSCFAKMLDINTWKTRNGVQVFFVKARDIPMIDIKVALPAGSAYDGKLFGLGALTNQMLNQGAGQLSSEQIAERLEQSGAIYDTSIERDMATLSLRTLSQKETFKKAFEIFSLILNQPSFKSTDIEREKDALKHAILYRQQSPNNLAEDKFYQLLYQNHPYAHPILGEIKTIDNISRNDIKNFYQTHYIANSAIVAIVGDLDIKSAKIISEELTKSLPRSKISPKLSKATIPDKKQTPFHIAAPSTQTAIRIGTLGINYHAPEYFPLIVGNYILGGGSLVSRLAIEVREKRGLTYGAYSYFNPLKATGPFIVALATANKQTRDAIQVTQKTLSTFIQQGPITSELSSAKKYLNGSFPLRLSSNQKILDNLVALGFYNLPINYFDNYLDKINQVSLTDIKKSFQEKIDTNKLILVTAGKV